MPANAQGSQLPLCSRLAPGPALLKFGSTQGKQGHMTISVSHADGPSAAAIHSMCVDRHHTLLKVLAVADSQGTSPGVLLVWPTS